MTSSVLLNFGNGHFQLSVRELVMNAREYSYKNLVDDPAIEWTTFVVVNGKITGVRLRRVFRSDGNASGRHGAE